MNCMSVRYGLKRNTEVKVDVAKGAGFPASIQFQIVVIVFNVICSIRKTLWMAYER